MGLEKIIKQLQEHLDRGAKKKTVRCDAVDELLDKLEGKRKKLEKKLETTSSGSKRKSLKLELKIVNAEIKRGKQRRDDIKKHCK